MIGVVTTSYPRGPADFAGSFVEARVHALCAAGAEVQIIAAGRGPDADPAVVRVDAPALFDGAGAPEALSSGGAIWGQAMTFTTRLFAAVAARASRWSALESHWLVPCGLVAATLAAGRPHRAHAHGSDVALLERLPSLARALCRTRPMLVFASDDLRRRFFRLCGAATTDAIVEPAPLRPGLFRPPSADERARARARLSVQGSCVLAVGRLVPVKGHDLLVAAVGSLPAHLRPTVVIVGDGPERDRLRQLARRASVPLRLPGTATPETVASWMAAADLLVHPSRTLADGRREGMPLAVREALASGLAVVVTASGGLPELACERGVALVPSDDAGALAVALMQHLAGPKARNSLRTLTHTTA